MNSFKLFLRKKKKKNIKTAKTKLSIFKIIAKFMLL